MWQLRGRGSFFELAKANSIDRDTADTGGYFGRSLTEASSIPRYPVAAQKLSFQEISNVVESKGKYFTLQSVCPGTSARMLKQVFNKAMELRKQKASGRNPSTNWSMR